MKIAVKKEIAYKDIKKYLQKCYGDLVPSGFGNQGECVNLVIFPCDRKGVVTSRYIRKALEKIKDTTIVTVYFAWCFSTEAKALVRENNGVVFGIHDFEWTDESWFVYKNGCG